DRRIGRGPCFAGNRSLEQLELMGFPSPRELVFEPGNDQSQECQGPLTLVGPLGSQIVRGHQAHVRFARREVEGQSSPPSAALPGLLAVPFVGQKVLERRQQKCAKATAARRGGGQRVLLQQTGEKCLRQVLRLLDVSRSPPRIGV